MKHLPTETNNFKKFLKVIKAIFHVTNHHFHKIFEAIAGLLRSNSFTCDRADHERIFQLF